MPRHRLAPRAELDLREIWSYVAVVQHSPRNADRLVDRIVDRFAQLAEHPLMGQPRPEIDFGMRCHTVPRTRYLIFYYPTDYGVEVARVIHGSQRITSSFE